MSIISAALNTLCTPQSAELEGLLIAIPAGFRVDPVKEAPLDLPDWILKIGQILAVLTVVSQRRPNRIRNINVVIWFSSNAKMGLLF